MYPECDGILPYSYCGDEDMRAKWNPMEPENHCFGADYMADGVAYVFKRIDKPRKAPATRFVVSAGYLFGDNCNIGNKWHLRHDQTGRSLGDYEVVGIVAYDKNAKVAHAEGVTDIRLPVACFK